MSPHSRHWERCWWWSEHSGRASFAWAAPSAGFGTCTATPCERGRSAPTVWTRHGTAGSSGRSIQPLRHSSNLLARSASAVMLELCRSTCTDPSDSGGAAGILSGCARAPGRPLPRSPWRPLGRGRWYGLAAPPVIGALRCGRPVPTDATRLALDTPTRFCSS